MHTTTGDKDTDLGTHRELCFLHVQVCVLRCHCLPSRVNGQEELWVNQRLKGHIALVGDGMEQQRDVIII